MALGYGYYVGAAAVTVLFLSTIVLFARFERKRKAAEVIYIEIDNAYKVNAVLKELEREIPESFTYRIFAPKSGNQGSVGLNVVIDKRIDMDVSCLSSVENIVFAVEE